MSDLLALVPAVGLAGLGANLLFRTKSHLAEAEAAHQRRLDDRHARGTDAFADELRSLEAYRPISSVRQRRMFGAVLLALAATCLFLVIHEYFPE